MLKALYGRLTDVEVDDLQRDLMDALTHLLLREQKVLARRYGLHGHTPMTQEAVAHIYDTTRWRIAKIEREALRHLCDVSSSEAVRGHVSLRLGTTR